MLNRAIILLSLATLLDAQNAPAPKPAPKPAPDTLVLTDGENLIGHFLRSTGATMTFKSDVLGELSIPWAKVKELHSAQRYAVVEKNIKLSRRADVSGVPKGSISMADQTLAVEPGAGATPQKIPVAEAAYVIDEPTFEKDLLHNPGFFEDWKGAVTAGASLVEATQQARTFTGSVAFIRAIPQDNWLDPRNRTSIDFSASDGSVIEPNQPTIKTNIIHFDAERDEYFHGKDLYGFVQTALDHNYSQGLKLQSNLGGGIGYTVIKKANETLDFRGSITYLKQNFQSSVTDTNLIGSTFNETFMRKTAHGILFLQQISITPAWSILNDYSASASGSVAVPVYKRFAFTTSVADNFLNNPPPSFKKNSFQLTTGLTYTLK
ncbi:MAG: DUF481 domain-containing protein [Bryobacteraceae bacterium]|jgi:hypothetical protein